MTMMRMTMKRMTRSHLADDSGHDSSVAIIVVDGASDVDDTVRGGGDHERRRNHDGIGVGTKERRSLRYMALQCLRGCSFNLFVTLGTLGC